MNEDLLNQEVQRYILDHLNTDVLSLLFKESPFPNIAIKELAEQIEAKAKSKKKLPTWFATTNIYYPNKLNISQTSSEVTANYKAGLLEGKTLLDMTGGFGVDSYAFSKKITEVYHLEENEILSKIASHNFKQLKANNIKVVHGDGLQYLANSAISYDWIYIDPSRRDEKNKRVYFLSQCKPDVTESLDLLFAKSHNILIKTGPLLDIEAGLEELKHVSEIHIVGVDNEVKELLWILKKGHAGPIKVKTVNHGNNGNQIFSFLLQEEKDALSKFSLPQEYLYEPNATILKSGAYRLLGKEFNLYKLHQHSHLYTSNELKEFPGRVFKIKNVLPFNKKSIKSLGYEKANISTRNFPISVSEIRKKTKWKEGGETYLFFTKNELQKLIIISCKKV